MLQKSYRNIVVRGSWIAHQHGARTCSYNRSSSSSFTEALLHALVAKFHFQKLHSPNFPYQCVSSFFCNISVPVAFLLNTAMNLLSEIERPKCFLLLYLQHGYRCLGVPGQRCCKAAAQFVPPTPSSGLSLFLRLQLHFAEAFQKKLFHQLQTIV